MATREISLGSYSLILLALVLLTGVTVGVSFLPLKSHWHIAAGLGIGAVKATLVVLFFMHAIFSRRLTWTVITVSIVFIFLLFSLTFSDYLTRWMVPYAPGH